MPRIISLSIVKNEQDIIEPFIRHHAALVDAMIVVDNQSVDDTRRITLDCARELGNVIVTDAAGFAYHQSERMTALLLYCQDAFFADFILLLDADEFLQVDGREALLAALEPIPPVGVGRMMWETYVRTPSAGAAEVADPPRTMTFRRTCETQPVFKAVLRLDGAVRHDLIVRQGNHNIITQEGAFLPTVALDQLRLMHFPVRSAAQVAAKSVVGWMAYLARSPDAGVGNEAMQWRDAYGRVLAGDLDLADMSMRYAQTREAIDWRRDAVPGTPPANYTRRHSDGAPGDPLRVIARSWEQSICAHAEPFSLSHRENIFRASGVGGTAFDAAWHRDHLYVDIAPFRFIAEKYQPGSVLDIGCGIGAYLQLFQQHGAARVFGVDGIPAEAAALAPAAYRMLDVAQPLALDGMFDLAICVEVAEHLPASADSVLVDNILRHTAGTIIFSAAAPGQPGVGHINCQDIGYWLTMFAARGWYPDLTDSMGMRAVATFSWFRRNLVLLRRGDPALGREAIAALIAIGQRPFGWPCQPAGIRAWPFQEALPPAPFGYAQSRMSAA